MVSKECPKCHHDNKGKNVSFCSNCGAKLKARSADEKKARLTKNGSSKKGFIVFTAVAGIFAFAAVATTYMMTQSDTQKISATKGSTDEPTVLTFPVSDFSDGDARFYRYQSPSGRDIRFFILKSSDGVLRAAFDTCDVCYPARKGYRQELDEMVCNNCDQRFASNLINLVRGGCNPAPLDRTVDSEKLVIKVSDILSGSRYF